MMWLCDGWDDYDDDDDDDHDHDDCKCGATSGLGGRNLIPYKKRLQTREIPKKSGQKLRWNGVKRLKQSGRFVAGPCSKQHFVLQCRIPFKGLMQ